MAAPAGNGYGDRLRNGAVAVGDAAVAGVNALANGVDAVLHVANATERSVNLLMRSTALQQVTYASMANAVYIASPQVTFQDGAIARGRFLEAGIVSYACIIHSLIMTAVWGIAALVQLGENARANYEAKHALTLIAVSAVCMGIGGCGVISPELGARATGSFYQAIWDIHASIEGFEGPQQN